MSVRASQAFAAHRQAVLAELQLEIQKTLVPSFNARIRHIEKEYKDMLVKVEEAKAQGENWGPLLLTQAEADKKAEILDVNKKKNEYIRNMNEGLKLEMMEKVKEYGGEVIEEEEIPQGKTTLMKVLKAQFPDGSKAKFPKGIFIDYTLFERVA